MSIRDLRFLVVNVLFPNLIGHVPACSDPIPPRPQVLTTIALSQGKRPGFIDHSEERMRLVSLLRHCYICCIVITLSVSVFGASVATEKSEVDSRKEYWRTRASWCSYGSGTKFASKVDDGVSGNTPQCNDGDSIIFNALLCLTDVKAEAGDEQAKIDKASEKEEVGCDVVKHSQTADGRWWRSPHRAATSTSKEEGGSETTFSNDHALGVMAYIAQTRDVVAYRNWMNYIKSIDPCASFQCLPGLPRYCPDDKCGFKFIDCPLLDRLAKYLGEENAPCASAPRSDLTKAIAKAIEDSAANLGGHDPLKQLAYRLLADKLLVQLKVKPVLDQIQHLTQKLGGGTSLQDSAEIVAITNSVINELWVLAPRRGSRGIHFEEIWHDQRDGESDSGGIHRGTRK